MFPSLRGSLCFGESPEDNQFGQVVYSVSQTPQVWLDAQVYEKSDELFVHWDYLNYKLEHIIKFLIIP